MDGFDIMRTQNYKLNKRRYHFRYCVLISLGHLTFNLFNFPPEFFVLLEHSCGVQIKLIHLKTDTPLLAIRQEFRALRVRVILKAEF